jgi:hypothetical protein
MGSHFVYNRDMYVHKIGHNTVNPINNIVKLAYKANFTILLIGLLFNTLKIVGK